MSGLSMIRVREKSSVRKKNRVRKKITPRKKAGEEKKPEAEGVEVVGKGKGEAVGVVNAKVVADGDVNVEANVVNIRRK